LCIAPLPGTFLTFLTTASKFIFAFFASLSGTDLFLCKFQLYIPHWLTVVADFTGRSPGHPKIQFLLDYWQ